MKLEIISVSKSCRMNGKQIAYDNRHERYTLAGCIREIEKIDLKRCGRWKVAYRQITRIGMGSDKYYAEGNSIEIDYGEAEKLVAGWMEEAKKAKKAYGNENTQITYYF